MGCYKSKNYFAVYDKRGSNGLMIIRSRGEGKHVMCFGHGLGLSKPALERWAGRVLKRLDQGSTEYEANVWIHAKMAEFRVGL